MNGSSDAKKWYFPGLIELWALQHYRNIGGGLQEFSYIPITDHVFQILDKRVLCIQN